MNKNRIFLNKGDKFNMFTVIEESETRICNKIKIRFIKCECECGNIKDINLRSLTRGKSTNCGCLRMKKSIQASSTHKMTGTRLYIIWYNMKARCNNKNHKYYKNYGGRGIIYEKKWEKFEGFYEDMKEGYSESLTIDRENNDGNYSKSNCRWETKKIQARNRKSNRIYKGKCLAEWCEELNLNYKTVCQRTYRGMNIKEALEYKNS